MTKWHNK